MAVAKKMKKPTRRKPKEAKAPPVSLAPLKTDQAMAALLAVKPPPKASK